LLGHPIDYKSKLKFQVEGVGVEPTTHLIEAALPELSLLSYPSKWAVLELNQLATTTQI